MHPHRSLVVTFTTIIIINFLLMAGCQPSQASQEEGILRYTQAVETILAEIVQTSVKGTMSVAGIASLPENTPQPSNSASPSQSPLSESAQSGASDPAAGSTLPPVENPIVLNTLQPTTPAMNEGAIKPGTYLVGSEIAPGLYYGNAVDCVYEKHTDLSGSEDAVITSGISYGQFLIEIMPGDYAFVTGCNVNRLNALPEPSGNFPQQIRPGMYLVGIEIQPGKYKGNAEDISCYWERMSDVTGEIDSIITNGGAVGQFFVQVMDSDFAILTSCLLERVGE